MLKDIKCPQCGGNRFKDLGDNTYKCMYCGTTFQKKEEKETVTPPVAPTPQPPIGEPMDSARSYYQINSPLYERRAGQKSKAVAVILAILLGGLGIHKFYLRQVGWGIIYLVFCWSYIPAVIGFIEGITYLCMSKEDFDYKYNS